uniref:Putative secreted protein n=1 Tax=Ixodes ricinus TaxID=34613 RepID=A0A6B0UCR4_IXORI
MDSRCFFSSLALSLTAVSKTGGYRAVTMSSTWALDRDAKAASRSRSPFSSGVWQRPLEHTAEDTLRSVVLAVLTRPSPGAKSCRSCSDQVD